MIGIFGGSFSPVHAGHLAVARGVLEKKLANEVWFMPCRRNPLKDGTTLLPDIERLRLLKMAVKYGNEKFDSEKMKISELELTMPIPSYTRVTLERLTELYPGKKFRLIVGADSYENFHKWKDWEWIVRNFHPVVYPRPGFAITGLKPGWTLLEGVREFDISSTQLRDMLTHGEDVSRFMPWIGVGSKKISSNGI